MSQPTDIEKTNLEAHVELCAERYNALEDRLTGLDTKINSVATMVKEVKDCVSKMSEKNNDRFRTKLLKRIERCRPKQISNGSGL